MQELNRELNACYLTIFMMASIIVTLFIMLTEANDTIDHQAEAIKFIKVRQEFDNTIEQTILTHYIEEDEYAGHTGVRF